MSDPTSVIEIVDWEELLMPPKAAVSGNRRENRPLIWVRLDVRAHRDPDILDLPPEERAIWPALLALAGQNVPHGRVEMTVRQLAREVDLPQELVQHALDHFVQRGRIRWIVTNA